MKDAKFFERVNKDYYRTVGAVEKVESSLEYYILEVGNFDPLYQEDSDPVYDKKLLLTSFTFEESDNRETDVGDTGMVDDEFDANLTISKAIWKDTIEGSWIPKRGDIVCMNPQTYPRWFYVLNVKEHGNYRTSGISIEWTLALKERASFSAARELR